MLSAAIATAVLAGCADNKNPTPETTPETETQTPSTGDTVTEDTIVPGTDKTVGEILDETDGPVRLEGEVTEIWFDELFGAFYPKQLKSMVFTKQYIYGDTPSKQPVLCLCSQRITDVTVFSVEDGEALYTVPELLPMEAVVLMVELTDKPQYGVRFNDEAGKSYSYTLTQKTDAFEVVYTPAE